MKKISILTVMFLLFVSFSGIAYAQALDTKALSENLAREIRKKTNTPTINVEIDVISKVDKPAGFYLIQVNFFDTAKGNANVGDQKLFTNGEFFAPDFLFANDMSSLMREIEYKLSSVDVDVNSLTLAMGNKNAKNVVIEITDFQCPYCIQANDYLNKKLKGNKNVAVYIIHMPLKNMHPKAELMAKIFEAGAIMDKNFKDDLFADANTRLNDEELIDKYAKKSGNTARFKELVISSEVLAKLNNSAAIVAKLGLSSTPSMIINDKLIGGFDVNMIDKAVADFK